MSGFSACFTISTERSAAVSIFGHADPADGEHGGEERTARPHRVREQQQPRSRRSARRHCIFAGLCGIGTVPPSRGLVFYGPVTGSTKETASDTFGPARWGTGDGVARRPWRMSIRLPDRSEVRSLGCPRRRYSSSGTRASPSAVWIARARSTCIESSNGCRPPVDPFRKFLRLLGQWVRTVENDTVA